MKIDEPDTPFEYTMKPISDSDSDEEEMGGTGGSGVQGGGMAGFGEADFAAAFEAKRHTVVQGVTEEGPAAADDDPEPAPSAAVSMDMGDSEQHGPLAIMLRSHLLALERG